MTLTWQWEKASRAYGNYGNANQWTVNAGMDSLARESAQNSNDARFAGEQADLVYTFIRLTGDHRKAFEEAAGWSDLESHLEAMASSANAAVTAGQIKAGLASIRSADDLVLLQIADYGCRGLFGPEFNDGPEELYGNFVKLCRLDLFSGKDEAAGGSFGLGKAVYWRFSRLQTVLFNSTLRAEDALGENHANRLFGVNAGLIHECGSQRYQGRGYYGVPDGEDVSSIWADTATVRSLHVEREDTRPGTTALLLGFYDPDEPDGGTSSADALIEAATKLRAGVESNFWPLLTRNRLRVTIRVLDDGVNKFEQMVDPSDTYTELVNALKKFDSNDISEDLTQPGAIIVRDVPIRISARKEEGNSHPALDHVAKLVVTLSDEVADSLENRVCLFRKPEMIVETVDKEFDSVKYHAFLLTGASIRPESPTEDELRADDFLRFSEPPAHDRWSPGAGRNRASQSNLTARYVAPWIPNLNGIRTNVLQALHELFGTPPPTNGRGPDSVLSNLAFLKSGPGKGGTSPVSPPRKPTVELTDWQVKDGQWHVTFEITARNRDEGWELEPQLRFVGLDGTGTAVKWESLRTVSGATLDVNKNVIIRKRPQKRKVTAVISGVSVSDLPIPADEAAIDVVIHRIAAAPDPEGSDTPEASASSNAQGVDA